MQPKFAKYALRVLLPITIAVNLFAQDPHRLDSLLKALEEPHHSDSLHADVYRQLANYHIELGGDHEALQFLDSLRRFSIEKSYELGLLFFHYASAYYYFRRGGYDSIEWHLERVIILSDEVERPGWKVDALNKLATVYSIRGNPDSARTLLDSAIALSNLMEDTDLQTMNQLALGNAFLEMGEYTSALRQFIMVDSILTKTKLYYRRGVALQNIGVIYLEQLKDLTKALNYFHQAKTAFVLEDNDRGELDAVDGNIARVMMRMGNWSIADSLFFKARSGFTARGHLRKMAELAELHSELKIQQGYIDSATSLLAEAEQNFKEIGAKKDLANVQIALAKLYRESTRFEESLTYLQNAHQNYRSPVARRNLLREMAEVYAELNQYQIAFDTLQSYLSISDTLNYETLQAQLQEIESRYQTAQKEREIVNLQVRQSRQELRSQQVYVTAFTILVLLALVASFFFFRARRRRKAQEKMQEIDELKNKMLANISHEFRTPLALIKSPIELVLKNKDLTSQEKQYLITALRQSSKLNQLVDGINDLARLEAGKLDIKIRPSPLQNHLRIMLASFESMAESKDINFERNLQIPDKEFYYSPEHFETIVTNLLSNAFKYTEVGLVSVKAIVQDHRLIMEIRDSGPGFGEEQIERIFDRYYRILQKDSISGLGIGLALAEELSRAHLGSIEVNSNPGSGATFKLILPIDQNTYEQAGFSIGVPTEKLQLEDRWNIQHKTPVVVPEPSIIDDAPIILVVEDNEDMQSHLQHVFDDSYRIVIAKNGMEGLEMAQQYIPDVVISDLMMPKLDGIAFLEFLKKNVKTSHIPFIMLTANHLEEQKLKGLHSGADDFLTKPFSVDELRLKVRNMIHYREVLRKKFQEAKLNDIENLPINDIEKQFLSNLQKAVKDHLNDSTFSVDDFARKMHLSRMQLHRKLRALTGLSATAFMRTERLKIAAKIIRKGQVSMSDVAYSVGFTSLSYFSRCFKEKFGVAPTEYHP